LSLSEDAALPAVWRPYWPAGTLAGSPVRSAGRKGSVERENHEARESRGAISTSELRRKLRGVPGAIRPFASRSSTGWDAAEINASTGAPSSISARQSSRRAESYCGSRCRRDRADTRPPPLKMASLTLAATESGQHDALRSMARTYGNRKRQHATQKQGPNRIPSARLAFTALP